MAQQGGERAADEGDGVMSGECLWIGQHHSGRVIEIMVGPDLPTVADFDADPLAVPPSNARAFTCEEHRDMVRAFLERHYQPRRSAYRDGRESP